MKDTQGNIITEEEFTKDIGHAVVDPDDMTLDELIDKEFVNKDDGLLNIGKYDYERVMSFIQSEIALAIDNRNKEVTQELLDMVEVHEDPKYCSIKIETLEALTSHKKD